MNDKPRGKGKASRQEGLEKAFDRAWKDAKAKGGTPGTYKVEIEVETINPIHAYIVTLDWTGDDD